MIPPHLKPLREIVYYAADHRPTAQAPYAPQGFLLDEEMGDHIVTSTDEDQLWIKERQKDLPPIEIHVTVSRHSYFYKTERIIYRKRRDDEPAPPT